MTGLNFGHKVEEKSSGDPIPKDTLLWCVLAVRGIKNSRETNGRYLDIELTVYDNQPYAKRKIWTKIADPFDGNNSEEWRNMGYAAIRRILEAVKGAMPDNPNSYTLNRLEDLHGLVVPSLVTIEKGKDGYEDKNSVEFLSPHSTVKKIQECFRLLQSGVFKYGKDQPAAAPAQGNMFMGTQQAAPAGFQPPTATPAAPTPSSAPGWLAPTQQAPVPQQAPVQQGYAPPQGFPQGQVSASPQQAPQQFPVNPAVNPQQGMMSTGQPAIPAAGSPSNGGFTPPPAQFPVGGQ